MSIKKISGTITHITDLSKTAKDITITLTEELGFVAGQFVNIFMNIKGKNVRRAFSISSSDTMQREITLSIRHSLHGVMSPLFWEKDLTGVAIELLGPLGINTADKLRNPKLCLFAYGVGAGVVKSILDHALRRGTMEKIIVMTGSRSSDEILHKEYFDILATTYPHIEIRHVISDTQNPLLYRVGYIQDHLDGIDFNDADIYACGQEIACASLIERIKTQNPRNCSFFIEAFH